MDSGCLKSVSSIAPQKIRIRGHPNLTVTYPCITSWNLVMNEVPLSPNWVASVSAFRRDVSPSCRAAVHATVRYHLPMPQSIPHGLTRDHILAALESVQYRATFYLVNGGTGVQEDGECSTVQLWTHLPNAFDIGKKSGIRKEEWNSE